MNESDPDTNENKSDPADPNQDSMFADDETDVVSAYKVLARKYRPSNFDDLIGQQPMVHTLTNAFASGRIAHAFMLTGVRGVGKTTTARLLARALNYQSDKINKPHMQLVPPGDHCAEISASRHMDVMEMDAASHTGIGDIREILDSVRYAPVSARYKIYIIDEVHMLSKPAFNALLKTLEEPPPHAIFILATTEIRKVPVTILSRCQRFDLSRVGIEAMVEHLQRICKAEKREVSKEGLLLIARASEGSVRDALSILDQALVQAESGEQVAAEEIRIMLGLADRSRVLNLFALTISANASGALAELREQYDLGADPVVIASDLLEHCHQITRAKALGTAADLSDYGPSAELVRKLADDLSMGQLSRNWQMLLKAATEIRMAPDPMAAAEMAVIRLCVAADLPSPEAAAKTLRAITSSAQQAATKTPADPKTTAPKSISATPIAKIEAKPKTNQPPNSANSASKNSTNKSGQKEHRLALDPVSNPHNTPPYSFEELLRQIEEKRELKLLSQLEQYVRLVSYQPGAISFVAETGAPKNLAAELSRQLQEVTGERWLLNQEYKVKGAETITNARRKEQERDRKRVWADPAVQTIVKAFPEAKIIEVIDAESDRETQ